MKLVIAFQAFMLALITAAACVILRGMLPTWLEPVRVPIICALIGGMGGVVYCLRSVYLNACVRKKWDPDWHPWYYIRPPVSLICGAVSFVFLKAGLLVLDATQEENANLLGFYALAFIAGFNVNNFLTKIEDIAHASWGIKRSRAGSEKTEEKEKEA